MINESELDKTKNNINITAAESQDITNKIEFEIVNGHYKTLKLGAIANIIGGFFYSYIIYRQVDHTTLYFWYFTLIVTSLADISWATYYQSSEISIKDLKFWRKIFLPIVAVLCLTWGSINILFNGNNQVEFISLAFLLPVLICFVFSSLTDFTVSVISISCLLLPTILFKFFIGMERINTGTDSALGICLALLVLGIFLTITSYIGNTVIRRYLRLNFENAIISKKLTDLNRTLEQRVKDRTMELERSLTLVKYQATHDLLTDLPNDASLLIYLDEAIQSASLNKQMFAVICFSVNDIGKINDGLGPHVSDFIIKRVAERLKNLLTINDSVKHKRQQYIITLSRQDVFVILINPIESVSNTDATIDSLFSILKEPIVVNEQAIVLTASVGMSVYPKDGQDMNTLLMNADAAKFSASKKGGNSLNIYDATQNANLSRQISVESQIHHALEKQEFYLQFQPVVDLKTGKICSAEALIRWKNSSLGVLSPIEFVPIAEANGMIIPIGMWVFKTACEELALWHRNGFTDLSVAINLSYKQLLQKNIVREFGDILLVNNVSPGHIELELIERQEFEMDAISVLRDLKALGISISMDDFGTGYSMLSSLKLFEIDKIKIDRSFIQDITTNNDSLIIVINTISLAKNMQALVVAEGVETLDQLKIMQEHGCDMVQGYYFSKPLDADQFRQLLEKRTVFTMD